MQQTSFDGGSVNDNSTKSDFEKLYEAYESGRNVLRDEFQKRLSDAIIKDSGDKEKLAGIFSELAKATWKLASKAASSVDDMQKQLALYYCNDAAIACQYVLKLAPKTSSLQETVYRTLNEVQSKIIEFSGGKNAKLAIKSYQELEKLCHRKELEDLRATTKQAIEKLDKNDNDYQQKTATNFSKIAGGIKQYLAALYKEAQEELLPMQAPCSYALIGLGSMAMEQMTPYSDIECAILTENNDYKSSSDFRVKHYFKNLSQLVHFKIISLGETIIPTSAFRLNLDDIVKPALNFDLGGKTPLGRVDKDKPYDLIQDIEQMLLYVQNIDNKSDHIDKNLAGILQKTTFIYGNQQLADDYSSKVSAFLLSKNAEGQVHCVAKAVKALSETAVEMDYVNSSKKNNEVYTPKGNLEQFSFDAFSSGGKLFDVKQEIYRMPDRLIYNLALIFGVQEGSSWQMVDTLKDKGFISEEASSNLKQALSFAANLRLKAYSHYGYQKEIVDYDKSYKKEGATEGLAKELSEYFSLAKDDLQEGRALFEFYYVMLALHMKLTEFCENRNEQHLGTQFFTSEKFYSDNGGVKGQVYYRLINYEKALECFEQELALQKKLVGEEHPYVATILNNIGGTYGKLNRHAEALDSYLKALKINEKNFSKDYPSTAINLNNVGSALSACGRYKEALEYHERALTIKEKILTSKDPALATNLNNVASTCEHLGNYKKALEYQLRALKILPKQHENYASCLNNLGRTYDELGEHNTALEYHKQALHLLEERFGDGHPHVANSLNIIGYTYDKLGKLNEALQCEMRALAIRKNFFGNDHPDVAESLNSVGGTYGELGQLQQALQYQQEALEIRKKCGNPETLAKSFNNVGLTLCKLGKYKETSNCYKQALTLLEQHLGKEHTKLAPVLNNIGTLYKELRKPQQALQYMLKALTICKKNFGDNHPDVAASLDNVGSIYSDLEQYNYALLYQLQALKIREEKFGNNHPLVATSLNNIGYTYFYLNNYEKATSTFKDAARVYFKLGKNDNARGMIKYAKQAVDVQAKYNQADKALQDAKNVVMNSNAAAKKVKELLKLPLKVLEKLQEDGAEAKALEVLNLLLAVQEQLIGTCRNKKALPGLRKEKDKLEQQKQEIEGKQETRKQKLAEVEAYLKEHGIDSKMIEESCFGSSVSNCNDDNGNTDDNSALLASNRVSTDLLGDKAEEDADTM